MSDLVAALHAELAAIHSVKPGHSLTGDYAALRGDAERLAAVVISQMGAAWEKSRELESELEVSLILHDDDDTGTCLECGAAHPCRTRTGHLAALARARELAQEQT